MSLNSKNRFYKRGSIASNLAFENYVFIVGNIKKNGFAFQIL